MPVAIDVWVFPTVDCKLPHPCGNLLHAAIFNVARDNNAELTSKIHDMEDLKPFTLSTLWPRSRMRSGDNISVPANTGCRFRLGTLNTDATEMFLGTLSSLMAESGTIRIGHYDFKVHSVEIAEDNGTKNYADLPVDISSVVLRFKSPTTFRRAGMSYPLPDPVLVFSSLWRKWQEYSDYHFDQGVFDELSPALAVSRADIKTRTWKFPKYQLTGFTGAVEFSIINTVSTEAHKLFGALANFTPFASVGLRTTMGFGQCAIDISKPSPNQEVENINNEK